MSERELYRWRVVFAIGESLKYIAHLDLLRTWERVLRRAGVPLAYSQGFNPHPKITIAMPLPVGCTSACEELDMVLWRALSGPELVGCLRPALPAGLEVLTAEPVDLRTPARPNLIRQADYQVVLAGVAREDVECRVNELMRQSRVEVEFRHKPYDLRPLISEIAVCADGTGTRLEMRLLRDENGRLGRPDVLLEALKLSAQARRIHRCRIVFADR